jgi:ankyrin repeat protein
MKNYITVVLCLLYFGFLFSQEKNVFDIARKGTLYEIITLYQNNPNLINSINDGNSNPLILACYRSNTEVAIFLAENVLDLNYNSGMGTALMAAVMSGNVDIVKKLIVLNADLNQSDTGGKTALIYATFFNKNEIAKLLIDAGANKNQKDKNDNTALDYATVNKNTELIILLN